MIFDTHCHLFAEQFDEDQDEVIKRANDANVLKMLVLGDKLETSIQSIEISKKYEGVYCAVGVFPCDCHGLNLEKTITKLKKLALSSDKVKAIGEIGLDYYWEKDENLKEEQRKFFVAQLKLANELELPVAIHARDSIEDVYTILKEHYPSKGAIMHCFSSSVEMMKKFIELGCYISLGGPVTYKNAETPKRVAFNVPLDRLLVETDSPYLSPVPYRGKRNEPAYVVETLRKIAEIKNIQFEELKKIVYNNSCKILGVKE